MAETQPNYEPQLTQDENNLYLDLPTPKEGNVKRELPTREKTSVYIPTIFRDTLAFTPSASMPNVMRSNDVESLLKVVHYHGDVGYRISTEDRLGLENDPTKQQVIMYAMMIAGDNILLYQRADKKDVKEEDAQFLGEKRLWGLFSIGFGGHTSDKDVEDVKFVTNSVAGLFRGIFPELDKVLGIMGAMNNEAREELGVSPYDLDFTPLGAFYEKFPESELVGPNVPVGSVHTCIAAVAYLNEQSLVGRKLILPRHEIAFAQWVPISELDTKLAELEANGDEVEPWTKIMAKEFVPELLTK